MPTPHRKSANISKNKRRKRRRDRKQLQSDESSTLKKNASETVFKDVCSVDLEKAVEDSGKNEYSSDDATNYSPSLQSFYSKIKDIACGSTIDETPDHLENLSAHNVLSALVDIIHEWDISNKIIIQKQPNPTHTSLTLLDQLAEEVRGRLKLVDGKTSDFETLSLPRSDTKEARGDSPSSLDENSREDGSPSKEISTSASSSSNSFSPEKWFISDLRDVELKSHGLLVLMNEINEQAGKSSFDRSFLSGDKRKQGEIFTPGKSKDASGSIREIDEAVLKPHLQMVVPTVKQTITTIETAPNVNGSTKMSSFTVPAFAKCDEQTRRSFRRSKESLFDYSFFRSSWNNITESLTARKISNGLHLFDRLEITKSNTVRQSLLSTRSEDNRDDTVSKCLIKVSPDEDDDNEHFQGTTSKTSQNKLEKETTEEYDLKIQDEETLPTITDATELPIVNKLSEVDDLAACDAPNIKSPFQSRSSASDGKENEQDQNKISIDNFQEKFEDPIESVLKVEELQAIAQELELMPVLEKSSLRPSPKELVKRSMFANSFFRYSWRGAYFDDEPPSVISEDLIRFLGALHRHDHGEEMGPIINEGCTGLSFFGRENKEDDLADIPSVPYCNSKKRTHQDRSQKSRSRGSKNNKKITGKNSRRR